MESVNEPGQIVILNGVPRSGKSSIVMAMQQNFDEPWLNLGVDVFKEHILPERYSPGIGLRPDGERPELEPLITTLYAAMYESIAAHSRLGLNVVVDVGHHDSYSEPLNILADCASRLKGLPSLFVGVHCPIEVIMERRRLTGWSTVASDEPIPLPVRLWQREVHTPGIYDLEVDTSLLSSIECAEAIRRRIGNVQEPRAFERLAEMSSRS